MRVYLPFQGLHCKVSLEAKTVVLIYDNRLRGALTFAMFICRFFIFDLRESSKFLVAKGRDEEAIEVS